LIRHSQSYLFGAISGTAVIAAAVVCFILFVSAQALRDWPISDLNFPGGGNDSAAVAPAKSLGGSSTNAAAANLNGPITAHPARVGAAAKAGGGNGGTASHRHHATGKVSPETQIQGGRGVDSAPVKQPSSSAPAPAPTTGSTPPAGSGTASPSPSGGNGSAPAGGNSGGSTNSGNSGNPPASSNVGTRTTRQVTKTVKEISTTATPPAPTPVTHAVQEVEERVAPTPPPAGSTSEKVAEAIGKIGK
jgi:hypothetical protein